MPGFNINANTGNAPNARAELRRAHRWAIRAGFLAPGEWAYLKSAQRPSITVEEVIMHHDQEKAYFAGQHTWEPITFEFYDAENDPDISSRLYDWLVGDDASPLCDLEQGNPGVTVNPPDKYKQTTVELVMVDGKGNETEVWTLLNAWPQKVNWKDLSYDSNEIIGVEVVLRFDRAVRSAA